MGSHVMIKRAIWLAMINEIGKKWIMIDRDCESFVVADQFHLQEMIGIVVVYWDRDEKRSRGFGA